MGKNATGKTTILEAIYLLSTTKSFRTTESQNLITFGKPFAKTQGVLEDQENLKELEIVLTAGERVKKEARIDQKHRSLISVLGIFPTVLFTPETLNIVLGAPFLRRRSMDILLSSVSKNYAQSLLEFLKIIRQRNKTLFNIRERGQKPDLLDAWDESFIKTATYLQIQREKLLQKINQFLPDKLEIIYLPSPKEDLKTALLKIRPREIELGFSLIGPQKDDFAFIWKGRPLSDFGSRGEVREGAILFKLAEWEFIKEVKKVLPVLLLDDIFSELDQAKRKKLEELFGKGQTILTTTSLSSLSSQVISRAKVIEL